MSRASERARRDTPVNDVDAVAPGDWERAREYLAGLPVLVPGDGVDPPLPDFDIVECDDYTPSSGHSSTSPCGVCGASRFVHPSQHYAAHLPPAVPVEPMAGCPTCEASR